MSYLRYLCLSADSGVQYILCRACVRLVNPMLPVSLDCPFLIGSSLFSTVYSGSDKTQFHRNAKYNQVS